MLQQQHSIDDSSHREFLQQETGGNSRRDFHPQVKSPQAKCQQAKTNLNHKGVSKWEKK